MSFEAALRSVHSDSLKRSTVIEGSSEQKTCTVTEALLINKHYATQTVLDGHTTLYLPKRGPRYWVSVFLYMVDHREE